MIVNHRWLVNAPLSLERAVLTIHKEIRGKEVALASMVNTVHMVAIDLVSTGHKVQGLPQINRTNRLIHNENAKPFGSGVPSFLKGFVQEANP